jgi:hypothetical protein
VILEGLVTSLSGTDELNLAPMGPRVESSFDRFILRPFRTSKTYRNLRMHGEGVLHVTDDVLLFARSAIGPVADVPTRPAEVVRGRVLVDCCRFYEFRVTSVDDREERVSFSAETLCQGHVRDFFGFNRAKHSVVEVAILATRVDFLPPGLVFEELEKHRSIVAKTGGTSELEAFALLESHIKSVARQPDARAHQDPE